MHAKTARQGLSVLELLVVLVVLGVLAGIASATFDRDASELSRATTDLRARVLAARYEAIKRNRAVFVRVEADRVSLLLDDPADGRADARDRVMLTVERAEYRGLAAFETNVTGGTFGWSPLGLPRAAASAGALGSDVRFRLVSSGTRRACFDLEPGGRIVAADACPARGW